MVQALGTFMRGLRSMAWPWQVWVLGLGAVNLGGGLIYAQRAEGRAALIAMGIAMGIMLGVVQARGFVRLLGIGHIVAWLPLLAWLATRLEEARAVSGLREWILVLLILDGASLILDVADVRRYARGDRAPIG